MNVKPVFFSLLFLLLMGNSGIPQTIKTDTVCRDLNQDSLTDKLIYENTTLTEFWQNTGYGRYTLHYPPGTTLSYIPDMLTPANPDSQYYADETATRLPDISDASRDCNIGDVDNDGDYDIIVANGIAIFGSWQYNTLLINNGLGIFTADSNRIPKEIDDTREIVLGDIDNDGDLDVYIGNSNSGGPDMDYADELWVNDGSGFFTDEAELRLPMTDSLSGPSAFVDFNNDGWLDIIVGNYLRNLMLINSGNGIYTDNTLNWLPNVLSFPKFYPGDFNRDMNVDVVFSRINAQDRILIHNGENQLVDETAQRFPQVIDYTYDMALGDIDADGDLDIFCANGSGELLWINYSGFFIDETSERLPDVEPSGGRSALIGDVDNDGDLDIFHGGYNSSYDPQSLYINDGSGYFTEESETRLPGVNPATEDAKFIDADLDGDLDIFLANAGDYQNRLFINHCPVADTFPPVINRITVPPRQIDTSWVIQTEVWDNTIYLDSVNLYLRFTGDDTFTKMKMQDMGGYLYRMVIPENDSTRGEFYIEALDLMGNRSVHPADAPDSLFEFELITGIDDNHPHNFPHEIHLNVFPNPFNSTVKISLNMQQNIRGELLIINLLGQTVKNLNKNQFILAGGSNFIWNGKDNTGKEVPGGIYFAVFRNVHMVEVKKVIFLK